MMLASAKGFWMTILIVLMVYFAFKLIWKYFGSNIIRFMLRKVGKRMEQKFKGRDFSQQQKESDQTSLDYDSPNKRSAAKEAPGEYIDYEEID